MGEIRDGFSLEMMIVLTSFSNAAHDWMVESSIDCFFLPDLLGCSPLVVTTLGFFFTSEAAAEENNILVNTIKEALHLQLGPYARPLYRIFTLW